MSFYYHEPKVSFNQMCKEFEMLMKSGRLNQVIDNELSIMSTAVVDDVRTINNPMFKFGIVNGEVVHYNAPYAKREVVVIDMRTMHNHQLYNKPKFDNNLISNLCMVNRWFELVK